MNPIHAHLTVCAAEAARVARGVRPDQLPRQSVCDQWTVRDGVPPVMLLD